MRISLLAGAALATILGASTVNAQTTVIERDRPGVVVDRSETRSIERRDTANGCSTETVSKENEVGDRKTVTKERCD